MGKTLELFNGMTYGVKVSEHGIKHGRLDYNALSNILGDTIYNDTIYNSTPIEDWELILGYLDEDDYVSQYYIISEYGYMFLRKYTDELVYYNSNLDVYLWGVAHYGTSWDYVLTNIKLELV